MWLEYAKLLRRAGREAEARRAEAHGHEIYAIAPHGGPETTMPRPALPPQIKTVTRGAVTAHFGGERPDNGPLRFGVKTLWFTFANDDGVYLFHPRGTLHFSDWRFDIFSPDGRFVLLLQDRFGPYHLVPVAVLKDYLRGRTKPAEIVGQRRKPGDVAAVHAEARWVGEDTIRYVLSCCGTHENRTHRIGRHRNAGQ